MSIEKPDKPDSTEDTEQYENSLPTCECGGNLIYIQSLNMIVCDTCDYEKIEVL